MIDWRNSLIFLLNLLPFLSADIETLHYESACLQQNNLVHLQLQCSQYEHIQIIRVIYGYSKQPTSFHQCQFSIYDCIQEGTSQNILSCNGKETCSINLTKTEMLATAINLHGVSNCPDFNYIQVNFACIPDSKDICDSWKDEGSIIHLSHTYLKNQQYNRCHCKIRSSIPNGQVLLHAREINRQYGSLKSSILPKTLDVDCKKSTYLEIATDRFERKCMDMFPSTSNALFGSGTHNFTLTYVKNDPLSELFFYLELKASPMRKDHNVQIICNWRRRSTTTIMTTVPVSSTPIISTTIPMTRRRKQTTMSMQRGGQLSRLDLIRHRPDTEIAEEEHVDMEETTSVIEENEYQEETGEAEEQQQQEEEEEEEETDTLTTTVVIKTKKAQHKRTSISSLATTKATTSTDDDEEWLRIISLAESESQHKELLSINNRTFLSAIQPSIINSDEKTHHSSSTSSSSSSSTNTLLLILLLLLLLTFLILFLYCLKVKRADCIQRIKLNTNVAFLFCCEAGKLLFCSSNASRHPTYSITHTPASTIRNRPSSIMPDYQSSEYYMDETGNNHCRTIPSIYDAGGGEGGGGKSIYSIDYDEEETEYTTKYGRHHDGSC